MFTTAWTTRERKDAAQALRDGARPDDVAARLGRTLSALKQAMHDDGLSWRALVREGRDSRIRAILAAGGGVAEVVASESCGLRVATRWISTLLDKGDRRHLRRSYTLDEQRRIYQSVREVGIKATADKLGITRSTVRRAAIAYRAEVLPTSPPLGRGPCSTPYRRRASNTPSDPPSPLLELKQPGHGA